jgi:serine/threonine protein phosphatase PrpC
MKIKRDTFCVLASDGVWQYMTNFEVAKIVFDHYQTDDVEGAVETIIREATQRWVTKENDTIVDDITCVIVFFDEDH